MARVKIALVTCLVGACGACSGGEGAVSSGRHDPLAPFAAVDTPDAPELTDPECGMAFDPAPELLGATERATERWSAATGCDVRIETGGVPVVLVTGLTTGSGKRAAGAWRHTGDGACKRVDIDDQLGGATTLAHELGHCLGARGHSETGLMAEGAPGRIDAASLSLVCSALSCSAFVPESP